MNNAITVFDSPEFGNVRVITDIDGELWFVAKDIAGTLDYASTNMTQIFSAVPDGWKGSNRIATPGGEQEMLCLTEQGLYFFLARSDKPRALPYQMWLAGDVVPSIRKHGGYGTPVPETPEAIMARAVLVAQDTIKRLESRTIELEVQAALDRPKVLFAEALDVSDDSLSIGNLAKLLKQNGVNIGQNRLFEWLRNNGWLMSNGHDWNMPTQRGMDAGYFEILERTINKPNGEVMITTTTRVTGKGQRYFINKFLAQDSALLPPASAPHASMSASLL